jgi:hypothetical protein
VYGSSCKILVCEQKESSGKFDLSVHATAPTCLPLNSLKFSFVNVGKSVSDLPQSDIAEVINKGTAPILASTFSEPFQVFSAKKFPGVIESTPLSKVFANQGIKIPIRKDGVKGQGSRGRHSDEDDGLDNEY